jgi:hypothetical protein
MVKNNGESIELKFPEIHKEIISATSHLEEIYQDFSFSKRLHYILDNQKQIKRWIKKESYFSNDLNVWIEDVIYNISSKKLNRIMFSNDNALIKTHYNNLYKQIFVATSFLNKDSSLVQRIWHIHNKIYSYPKCE